MSLEKADQQEEENKAAPAPAAQAHGGEDEVKEGTHGERVLDKIILKYGAEPAGIARGLTELSPSDNDQVMRVLQSRFGNAFVSEVEREIGILNQLAHQAPTQAIEDMAPPTEEQKKELDGGEPAA
jgi:hypothetical protein